MTQRTKSNRVNITSPNKTALVLFETERRHQSEIERGISTIQAYLLIPHYWTAERGIDRYFKSVEEIQGSTDLVVIHPDIGEYGICIDLPYSCRLCLVTSRDSKYLLYVEYSDAVYHSKRHAQAVQYRLLGHSKSS